MAKFLLGLALGLSSVAVASPLLAPGETDIRHDLQWLNDNGVISIPLSAWPLSNGDIHAALSSVETGSLSDLDRDIYRRVSKRVAGDMETDWVKWRFDLSGAHDARLIRSFLDSPRETAQVSVGMSWTGERFAMNLAATAADSSFDNEEFRPDGSFLGVAVGNWMLTAGWQDRWWGPGHDGSLILGTNARPSPGIALQRNVSMPFETKWLSWIGRWTLATFMTELDDSRVINDAWLFGIRGTFRPPNTGLEIGISRVAQWCGADRPCDFGTFADLLIGNDNRGVNVSPEDEPGNQLGGFDVRWRLPANIPASMYMQWIGEDGRGGGGAIGAWIRQLGVEFWGRAGSSSYRTHLEVSDTACRQGGFGLSGQVANCGYEHAIYNTGFRFRRKSLGHPIDGDGLSYSIGSTLVQSGGRSWNFSLRHMEINRVGPPNGRHSLSNSPIRVSDIQISHRRTIRLGQLHIGLGYSDIENSTAGQLESGVSAFLRWSSL